MAYSNRLRTPPTVSQFAPSWTPGEHEQRGERQRPEEREHGELPIGMRDTPAANETSERMTGIIRPKKLAASP